MKKYYLVGLIAVIVCFVLFYSSKLLAPKTPITNFESCAAAGNPIMESYPEQCAADGKTYTANIGNELEKTELIQVETPRPNAEVSSPLVITGKARGTWFFEAEFPIYLYDSQGNEVAHVSARAQGEWMTEDFVPFSAELPFPVSEKGAGELILRRSNPSGLPENDDELRIPLRFASPK
jgi:Immunoglobulin-like domain of bacterial spore germination